MKKQRRHRYESELDYTRDAEENSRILLKEKYEMLRWTDTVEIKTPNLLIPAQIANYVESLPFCKLTVSPSVDRFALMHHSRQLDIYAIDGQNIIQESSVQVLEDEFVQYCLLEFTASGSLLLSTRSTAQVDVFDHQGGYCYDISLKHPGDNFDILSVISSIRTFPNTSSDDKYLDILYLLQYSGTLSVFKIGRLSKFQQMWSISLELGLTGTFCVLQRYNLLLVSSHYRVSSEESLIGGLCSFRLMDSEPWVEPIRFTSDQGGWLSRLPFSSGNYAYLVSMSVNESLSKLAAVSSNGDFFLFDIPSTRTVFSIKYISGPRPVQVVFTEDEEVGVLFHSGELVRSTLDELRDSIHSLRISEKFTPRTTLVAPCRRELFVLSTSGDTNTLREVTLQRTSLACRLWLYTIWASLKKLVGVAVGDTTVQLERATYSESLDFVLLHAPTRTLQELFERTLNERDYSRAKSLAESYDTIDIDIVLKREWRDICHSQAITEESVDSILRQINDKDWIVEACITSDAPSLYVQKALIDLGSSFPNAALESQVRLHHNARILTVCECVDEYIEVRSMSCLDAAYRFAERLNFVLLDRLIERNYSVLIPFILDIVSHIPPSVPPKRFEHLLPTKNGTLAQLDKVLNSHLDTMFALGAEGGDDIMNLVNIYNTGNHKVIVEVEDLILWARKRVQIIDSEAGLIDHCIALLNICIQRGYEELTSDLECFTHYNFFVTTCSLVGETFNRFCEASSAYFVSFLRNLPEGEIVRNLPEILSLLKWRTRDSPTADEDLRKTILSFLSATSQHNIEVLKAMQNQSSVVLDRDILIQCLCCLELTGDMLLRAVVSVGVCPDLACSLSTFHSRGVKPTFKQLWDSTTDADCARRLLIRMARCGQATSVAEWEALRDEVLELALSIYSELITPDEALDIVIREMLSDGRISHDKNILKLFLTLDKSESSGSVHGKLNIEKSAEVLITKSEELMQEASSPSDPILRQSRIIVEAAKNIAPAKADKQLKLLNAVDLAHELGSTALPVAIKFAEPYVFLQDVVKLDGNYKQGKKCASLAILLGVETPVATALSLCALSALLANDERYLCKYIHEVMAKGRDLAVVHELCIRIMESPFIPAVMEDIYACALLNSPEDKLTETLDLIQCHSVARKRRFCQELSVNDKLVIDPMYARSSTSHHVAEVDETSFQILRECYGIPTNALAILLTNISAPLALCIAMSEVDCGLWTKNDFLLKYEQALRFLEPQLTERLVEAVPPSVLISQASLSDENVTILDRLSHYGCDRERFVEDAHYRNETIMGLAMTDDDDMYADAIHLAAEFKLDDWPVHFASLENALTSLSISEAKTLLKSRGHLARLRSDPDRLHRELRSSVAPLMTSNEQFIAYLTLFADGETERAVLPVIKRIVEKKRDVQAFRLFTDTDYLRNVIVSMPDRVILSIESEIRLIPIGVEACEAAAAVLLNGNDIRPAAHPAVIFSLLGKDETNFIDLVASKDLSEELLYLEKAVLLLEATPNVDGKLLNTVRERLATLSMPTEDGNNSVNSFDNGAVIFHRKKK